MEGRLAGASVTFGDYEVLGLASDGRHFFWILFFGLHGMSSRTFVGGLRGNDASVRFTASLFKDG